MGTKARDLPPPSPPGFRVDRELPVGRHPLLAVFPGLDRLSPAQLSTLAEISAVVLTALEGTESGVRRP